MLEIAPWLLNILSLSLKDFLFHKNVSSLEIHALNLRSYLKCSLRQNSFFKHFYAIRAILILKEVGT